jgi:hypothetical protein
MSERYEMTTASGCPVTLESPGEDIGEDILTGHALVIGDRYSSAMVVEGTRAELLDFAEYLVRLVEGIETP